MKRSILWDNCARLYALGSVRGGRMNTHGGALPRVGHAGRRASSSRREQYTRISQGLLAVLLGVYLSEQLGLSRVPGGVVLQPGVSRARRRFSFVSTFVSERVGRRGLLVFYTGMTLVGGAVVAVVSQPTGGCSWRSRSSARSTVRRATLGRRNRWNRRLVAGVVTPARRTELFALYRVSAATVRCRARSALRGASCCAGVVRRHERAGVVPHRAVGAGGAAPRDRRCCSRCCPARWRRSASGGSS